MTDMQHMLTAHIRFELRRWDSDRAADTLTEDLGRLFDWLEPLPASDLVSRGTVRQWVGRYLCTAPVTEDAYQTGLAALLRGQASAADQQVRVGDLVAGEDFQRLARAVIGMKEVQTALIEEITTSEVYSRLISHVLYEGVKGYLTHENVISRRVPGASSVMRLGQSALGSAAPGLSRGIDRQLSSFVAANISDTMRDSREYLQQALDDDLLLQVADDIYASAAEAPLAEVARQIEPDVLTDLAAALTDMWIGLRGSEAFAAVSGDVADELYERLADQPVAELMAIAGLAREDVLADVLPVLTAAVAQARRDGALESWIRDRLQPFYDSYTPAPSP